MKRKVSFKAPKDLIIFKDSQNESVFYGMTEEVLSEKMKIVNKYGKTEKDVPDDEQIMVCPIKLVKQLDNFTDEYVPEINNLIEFPINRIEWIWIQIIEPRGANISAKEVSDLFD